MKKILTYILFALIIAGCSESEYDSSRTASLQKRYLDVVQTSYTVSAGASNTVSLGVISDETPWKIDIPVSWILANKSSGTGPENVNISISANNSADTSRVCIVNVSSNVSDWNFSIPVSITQMKASPSIEIPQASFTLDGKSQNFNVSISSNIKYTASSTGAWVSVKNYTYDNVELAVDENTTGNARSCQVTLSAVGITKYFTIVQRASNITSTTHQLDFTFEASSANINVESEASWSAVSSDWITLSQTSGKAGSFSISASVSKNQSVNTRNGFVYLTIDGKNRVEVPVVQTGIYFDLSATNISFDSFGGNKSFTIKTNDKWEMKSCPSWVSLNATSGNGDATVTVTAQENNSTTVLNGEIILRTTDNVVEKRIKVSQSAKTIDIGTTSLSFGYSEESQTFSITTDGQWTASCDADWITLDKTSGSGNATIIVKTKENMATSNRNGIITLNVVDKVFKIEVHQESKYLNISSDAFHFTSQVGHTTVAISSNTNWNARVKDKPNWLIVTPSSGSKNADITIGVSENNTPAQRTGVVEVEIPNVRTYLIDITQDGKYIKADKSSVEFTSSGGTIVLNVTTDGTFEVSKSGNWFGYTRNGNAITIVAPSNNSGAERTGSINLTLTNLSSGAYTLNVDVKQER